VGHEMVGQLIGVATMRAGLTVNAKLDKTQYPINLEVTEEDVASVNLGSHALYGEWTYAIRPTRCICRP
jgi:DDE family transposase